MMLESQSFLNGTLIREPVGEESGYWVGAPGVFLDPSDDSIYLTYRIRRPRGVAPDRGGEARIARSRLGVADGSFEDIWTVHKDAYQTTSIERSAIRRGRDGRWRYFTSYVDPADGRWCTAVIKSDAVEDLDPASRRVIFTAGDLNLEGVKDPVIFEENGIYHMFLSVAESTTDTGDRSHETNDIYNTGQCLSATGLATSTDLENWAWQGVVFRPEPNAFDKQWDGYCRRINSVIRVGDQYVSFFDGSKSHHENYEERTGIATSTDLRSWQSQSPDGPIVTTPNATGSIRYIDVLPRGNDQENDQAEKQVDLYFEIARKDSAHELRRCTVSLNALCQG